MVEIIDFLLARISEDEEAARAATCGPWERCTFYGYKVVTNSRTFKDPEHEAVAQRGGYTRNQTIGHVNPSEDHRPIRVRAVIESANGANTDFIVRWDPARVLAECKAKRALVDLHQPIPYLGFDKYGRPRDGASQSYFCAVCQDNDGRIIGRYPCDEVKILASIYSDQPDFQEDWKL